MIVTAQDSVVAVKTSSDPKPNVVDNQDLQGGETPYLMPRQTGAGNARGIQNVTGYIAVINPDTNINQIIIGVLPNGEYGIAISKPGIDVLSAFNGG